MLSPEEHAEFLLATETVRQAALGHLAAEPNVPQVIYFIARLQRGVDSIAHAVAAAGPQFDCKAGCSHCCHVRVEALEPEVFQIARELKQLPAEKLAAVTLRLQQHGARRAGAMSVPAQQACPFLEHQLCSIYAVRPAVCRKAHSFALAQCEVAGAEAKAEIPQSLALLLKAEAMMQGTAAAYRERGLAAAGHELGQAVLLALSDATAESRWALGEAVFDATKLER